MNVLFSIHLDEPTLLQALKELMPTLSMGIFSEATKRDISLWPDITFEVVPNKSDFPTDLRFMFVAPEEFFIEIARRLSIRFKCNTVCEPGKFKPKGFESSPFWVIVWKEGQAFLGDDVDWEGDLGEGGRINVFHPIEVPEADLQTLAEKWRTTIQARRAQF